VNQSELVWNALPIQTRVREIPRGTLGQAFRHPAPELAKAGETEEGRDGLAADCRRSVV